MSNPLALFSAACKVRAIRINARGKSALPLPCIVNTRRISRGRASSSPLVIMSGRNSFGEKSASPSSPILMLTPRTSSFKASPSSPMIMSNPLGLFSAACNVRAIHINARGNRLCRYLAWLIRDVLQEEGPRRHLLLLCRVVILLEKKRPCRRLQLLC
jgi:hypothetical protein